LYITGSKHRRGLMFFIGFLSFLDSMMGGWWCRPRKVKDVGFGVGLNGGCVLGGREDGSGVEGSGGLGGGVVARKVVHGLGLIFCALNFL
jgi:hypothetical protein